MISFPDGPRCGQGVLIYPLVRSALPTYVTYPLQYKVLRCARKQRLQLVVAREAFPVVLAVAQLVPMLEAGRLVKKDAQTKIQSSDTII